jgi:hypothetical protein
MNGLFTVVIGLGLGLTVAGCGGDDDEGDDGGGGNPTIYCQVEDMGAVTGCNEHTVPTAALDAARDACTSGGATLVDRCPSAGRVGSCALVNGTFVINYYEGDDPADAEAMCVGMMGEWSSG